MTLIDFVDVDRYIGGTQHVALPVEHINGPDPLSISMPEDIHKAIETGNAVAIEAILDERPAELTSLSRLGDTPLHKAIWRRKTDVARLLIDRGADVNAIGNQGNLPLHYASSQGDPNSARLLIMAGAKVESRNGLGFTPLFVAARGRESGCTDVAILLLELGANLDLHSAVCLGRADDVRRILDANQDAVADCRFKEDLIVDGVIAHSIEIVEMLIDHGAGIDDFKLSGASAIFSTLGTRADPAMVKALIAHGANVNAKNQSGRSVLTVANRGGNQAIIDQIVNAGGTE